MQFTLTAEWNGAENNSAPVAYLTLEPGEVVALPSGKALRIRSVSGTAYITHTGRDLLLWRGDAERLEAMPARVWGAPVVSALGKQPVTISIETEEQGGLWEPWLYERQEATVGQKRNWASIPMKNIWTRWQARFVGKRLPEVPRYTSQPC